MYMTEYENIREFVKETNSDKFVYQVQGMPGFKHEAIIKKVGILEESSAVLIHDFTFINDTRCLLTSHVLDLDSLNGQTFLKMLEIKIFKKEIELLSLNLGFSLGERFNTELLMNSPELIIKGHFLIVLHHKKTVTPLKEFTEYVDKDHFIKKIINTLSQKIVIDILNH